MNLRTASRMDELVPSGIRKINEQALKLEQSGKKILHFELGRPDFDTPEYIKRAAILAIEDGDVFYTSNFGTMELRRTIAGKLQEENGIPYEAEEILVTVGLSEAVFDTLCSVLNPGDEILIPDPVWMNYLNVPKLLGAVPVSYHLREGNDYQIDLEEIRRKITPRTKALVIVTPNNPTGSVLSRRTLEGLAEIAVKEDLLVLSDEIYERLVYDGEKHLSIAALPGMKERTFTLNGFSKAWSMTGWRIGYVAAPREYIAVLNKIHQHNTTCAPSFVQAAAVAAMKEETDEVEKMVREYAARRDETVQALNTIPGISCRTPKGAFYLFINIQSLGYSSEWMADYLLREAGVALVPGSVFGPGGEGYLRLSFAASREDLKEGCHRIRKAVEALVKQNERRN